MSSDWQIDRISLTTAQPESLVAFYCRALGFVWAGTEAFGGNDFARVMSLPGAQAEATLLRLGGQCIELLAFAQKGRPYPAGSTSADSWFQHIAIVVSDMRAAYARLSLHEGWTPISTKGPQRLPEVSGGVTAFKFRDPEGHPLELLEFPYPATPSVWKTPHGLDPCLGIDHSAISVLNTAASTEFYAKLGFAIRGQSLNFGPTQQRLDGLADVEVQVTTLEQAGSVPHLELLCYSSAPSWRTAQPPYASNDVATTRLLLLPSQQSTRSPDLPSAAQVDWSQAEMLIDPDGHYILLGNGLECETKLRRPGSRPAGF